jgi:hypothetical protein
MATVRAINLAIRFFLELAAFAALGLWGWRIGDGGLTGSVLAVVLPLIAIAAWGTFVAPRSLLRPPSAVRFAVEIAVFAAAVAGLFATDRPGWAIALAVIYLVNRALLVLSERAAGGRA